MRKVLLLLILLGALVMPVSAMDITPPSAPPEAEDLMPVQTESFSEGLWTVIKSAVGKFAPDLKTAAGSCLTLGGVVLLGSFLNAMPGSSKKLMRLLCALAMGTVFVGHANAMINLCVTTVRQVSDYGKLLLPVMTTALAAQGGTTSATALYAGTAIFNTVLGSLISNLLIPLVYVFLALAIANSATGEDMLKKMRDFIKWLMTWGLKIILYVFTGYMSITRVITGNCCCR